MSSTLQWIAAGASSQTCGGALIWLHGLGADGHDFAPVIPSLKLNKSLRLRFIFPHAPVMPVTINGGMLMPAWYDIAKPDLAQAPDWSGIMRSVTQIHDIIDSLVSEGVPCEKIALAGFSQGGVIAMMAALTAANPLKGLVILSSYLPEQLPPQYETKRFPSALPVFLAHGREDTLVPIALGSATIKKLTEKGAVVSWYEYAMAHQACEEELHDIGVFLNNLW